MSDSSPVPDSTPSIVAALDALFASVNRGDAPGLVVGVAHRGETIYRRGFGLASLEHATANTPWTRMRIGSTSKHFTCLAVLLLAEDGLVDPDAPVRDYLPELPARAVEPTVRQLMSHTSGLRCHLDIGFLGNGEALTPDGGAWETMKRQREVNFAPGENMVYCNGGYHLMSLLIEKLAGVPFEQFLRDRIFRPLGMRDTASVPSDLLIVPGIATMHVPIPPARGGGWRRGIFPSEEVRGEGAMVSTIDDMLGWLAHLRADDKRVGSAETWRQMLAPAVLKSGLANPYALGLMVHDYRGLRVVHHAGGVVGGTCQMLTVPDHALDIIMMVNGAPANPMELANRIIDTVLADHVGEAPVKARLEDFLPMRGARYADARNGRVIEFSEGEPGLLGLRFLNGPPVGLRVEGERLRAGFEDMAIGPLSLSAAQLTRTGPEGSNAAAAPAALDLAEAGIVARFERLPADPPPADIAAALAGRYVSHDLDAQAVVRPHVDAESGETTWRLEIDGQFGRARLALTPWSSELFGWQEVVAMLSHPSTGQLRVERRDGPGSPVVALRMDTHRSRHVLLERLPD